MSRLEGRGVCVVRIDFEPMVVAVRVMHENRPLGAVSAVRGH